MRLTKWQVEDRRVKIARLYFRGYPQTKIAKELGMERVVVTNDLKAIHKLWLESTLVPYDQRMAIEIAKIDDLELMYREAWEESKRGKQKTGQKKIIKGKRVNKEEQDIGDEETLQVSTDTETNPGNEKFLRGIMDCVKERCKLFDLYAPSKIQFSWKSELPEGYLADQVEGEFIRLLTEAAEVGE